MEAGFSQIQSHIYITTYTIATTKINMDQVHVSLDVNMQNNKGIRIKMGIIGNDLRIKRDNT